MPFGSRIIPVLTLSGEELMNQETKDTISLSATFVQSRDSLIGSFMTNEFLFLTYQSDKISSSVGVSEDPGLRLGFNMHHTSKYIKR